jgi:hypothetical protein
MHAPVSPCCISVAQSTRNVLGYTYLEIGFDYVYKAFRKLRFAVSGSEATECSVWQDSTRFTVRLLVGIGC